MKNEYTITIHCGKPWTDRDAPSVQWRYTGGARELDVDFEGQIQFPPARKAAVMKKK